jgi:hypothetical protein
MQRRNGTGTHLIILDIDAEGAIYLSRGEDGVVDGGMRTTRWANHYTEGAAYAVAAKYPRAIVAPLPIVMPGGRQ